MPKPLVVAAQDRDPASLVDQLGPMASVADLQSALAGRSLDARDVARCLTVLARDPPHHLHEVPAVRSLADLTARVVNWDDVLRSLDEVLFPPLRPEGFAQIVLAYKRAMNRPVPGQLFLGEWRSPESQAAMLFHAVFAAPEDVLFDAGSNDGTNGAWRLVAVTEAVLRVAESGQYAAAHAALQRARSLDPDGLLLSLLHSRPRYETLREELYAALVPALLFQAMREDPTGAKFEVLSRVWDVNRELVMRGMLDVVSRDPEVLNLVMRLPDGLHFLLVLPLRISLAAACAAFAANPTAFNLEKWLTDRLGALMGEQRTAAVREALRFAEKAARGGNGGGRPSTEALTSIFKALTSVASQASAELGLEVHRVLEACRSADPGLQGASGSTNDIEEQANARFQQIYTGVLEMDEVVAMLQRFKDSPDERDQSIFACMIHNLFDEYRFFHNYPDKELRITGVLFGNLIKHQLISSWTLSMAIKYVLDALRRTPGNSPDGKIFRFGVYALEQFKTRLPDLPHVCSDLIAIPHLAENQPELYAYIQQVVLAAQQQPQQQHTELPVTSPVTTAASSGGGASLMRASSAGPASSTSSASAAAAAAAVQKDSLYLSVPSVDVDAMGHGAGAGGGGGGSSSSGGGGMGSMMGASGAHHLQQQQQQLGYPLRGSENADDFAVYVQRLTVIFGLAPESDDVASPGAHLEDTVHFVINNLTRLNMDEKVNQAKSILSAEHYKWVAHYLVVKRVATQQNFHAIYMHFLEAFGDKQLFADVRFRTLTYVRKLLCSNKIVSSTTERSLLKNLGSWLGQLTLAKNKPLLQRECDLKELLLDGYERGCLIAVVPFAAKVLEAVQQSKIFVPPNPWLMGIVATLAELYQLPELKLNLKFEIEVLCKNLQVELQSVAASHLLAARQKPRLTSNPDFNVKVVSSAVGLSLSGGSNAFAPLVGGNARMGGADGAPVLPLQQPGGAGAHAHGGAAGAHQHHVPAHQQPFVQQQQAAAQLQAQPSLQPYPQQQPPQQQQQQQQAQQQHVDQRHMAGDVKVAPGALPTETVIPNLAAYVYVNTGLPLFVKHPELKRVVPVAVDRAIREIIQPVVERSVSIACITSRELITKDFASEPNEKKLMQAAHLMVSNLAGALALVTCKDPLRASMSNHLRQLLSASTDDSVALEQVALTCSQENLELGCLLIEKAATEKALRDINDALELAVAVRADHRERSNDPFFDSSVFATGARYPAALPPALRPKPSESGLSPEHFAVYEAFQRVPRAPAPTRDQAAGGGGGGAGGGGNGSGGMMSSQQALERYKQVVLALDVAVQKLLQQPGFHDIPISMLPADHEVLQQLGMVRVIVATTAPEHRGEVASVLAQSVFKRLFDGSPTDNLRLSVQVGALEAVSSALDGAGLRGKITEWILIAVANGKLNLAVTVALVDAHLVGGAELDALLADLLEGSLLSTVSLGFAVELVQRCVLASRAWTAAEASRTLSALRNIALGKTALAPPAGLARVLTEVAELQRTASAQQQQQQQQAAALQQSKGPQQQSPMPPPPAQPPQPFKALPAPQTYMRSATVDQQSRKQVEAILQQWALIQREGESASAFLTMLHEKGLVRGDKNLERFLYVCTEISVESFLTVTGATPLSDGLDEVARARLAYTSIDSFSVLVCLLVKLVDARLKPAMLAQALEAVARVMAHEVTTRAAQGHETAFDQRPYFRLLLNYQREMLIDAEDPDDRLLACFAEAHHHYLRPERCPGFAFSWFELVSHCSFMPRLLRDERGWNVLHRLLQDVLVFLEPMLKHSQLSPAVRVFYKGMLRVLLVLLHDRPEFLCSYHFSLLNSVPTSCVQLRSLILSAFPRSMRLPDPFTPNLKVDLLPEIAMMPRILTDYTAVLGPLREDLDLFMKTRTQPPHFIQSLPGRLTPGGVLDAVVLNSLVLYVGVCAIAWHKAAEGESGDAANLPAAREIFQTLATVLSPADRYVFLNSIANHLRYPNAHTHFFSCVCLGLFKECDEAVKEQVTRVLLERLIAKRPHPWGLLVTFIELIKNPRYGFWSHSFTKITPEIQLVFESVAQSCGGAIAAAE